MLQFLVSLKLLKFEMFLIPYPLKSLKKKAAADNQTSAEKKKLPEKLDEKDKDISVSLLKLQIGHIKKAWKHPSADRYYS